MVSHDCLLRTMLFSKLNTSSLLDRTSSKWGRKHGKLIVSIYEALNILVQFNIEKEAYHLRSIIFLSFN